MGIDTSVRVLSLVGVIVVFFKVKSCVGCANLTLKFDAGVKFTTKSATVYLVTSGVTVAIPSTNLETAFAAEINSTS